MRDSMIRNTGQTPLLKEYVAAGYLGRKSRARVFPATGSQRRRSVRVASRSVTHQFLSAVRRWVTASPNPPYAATSDSDRQAPSLGFSKFPRARQLHGIAERAGQRSTPPSFEKILVLSPAPGARSHRVPCSRYSRRSRAMRPAEINPMSVSQSASERRRSPRRRCRRARRCRNAGPPGAADKANPSVPAPWLPPAFLPCVDVGSGLPPSAQTSRSIIAFSAVGA